MSQQNTLINVPKEYHKVNMDNNVENLSIIPSNKSEAHEFEIEMRNHESDHSKDRHLNEKPKKRKRGSGPMQRKLRKERSISLVQGLAYVNPKGKTVAAKPPRPLSDCKLKCRTKIDQDFMNGLYSNYRSLSTRNMQRQYLASMIILKSKARESKNSVTKNRTMTACYNVDYNGVLVQICKSCFMAIYGESVGFINEILKKKKNSNSDFISDDQRGKHEPQIKKDMKYVRDHISKHTKKKYVPHNVNLSELYNLYRNSLPEKCVPVSLNKYCLAFQEHHDSLKALTSEDERSNLKINKEECVDSATNDPNGKVVVAVFDLQKCLETPNLTTNISIYKRKLWTFNLTVRNCTSRKTSCFVWHEGIANRGANEIASCLYKFILELPDQTEKLVLYSETYPGQNRNSILPIMFSIAINKKINLNEIDHKFLSPDRIHDSEYDLIKNFRKHDDISDRVSLIKKASPDVKVTRMIQADFFSFSSIFQSVFVKKTDDSSKSSLNWTKIYWIRICKEEPGIIKFKYDLKDGAFSECSLTLYYSSVT